MKYNILHIPQYLKAQYPLDYKTTVTNYSELLDLGEKTEKPYTYYKGMLVLVMSSGKYYTWTEWEPGGSIEGVLPEGYTYPDCINNDMYDYSGKTFNFVELNIGITDSEYFDEGTWARIGTDEHLQDIASAIDRGFSKFYFTTNYTLTENEFTDDFDSYTISTLPGVTFTIGTGVTVSKEMLFIDTNVVVNGTLDIATFVRSDVQVSTTEKKEYKFFFSNVTSTDLNYAGSTISSSFSFTNLTVNNSYIVASFFSGTKIYSNYSAFDSSEIYNTIEIEALDSEFSDSKFNTVTLSGSAFIKGSIFSSLSVLSDGVILSNNKIGTLDANSKAVSAELNYIGTLSNGANLTHWDRAFANLNLTDADEAKGNVEVIDRRLTSLFSTVDDHTYATSKAVKDYVDNRVLSSLHYQGTVDASTGNFPTAGSGLDGSIKKGDVFIISVAGTLDGEDFQVGDFIIANKDGADSTLDDWDTVNTNITYIPEDSANKATVIDSNANDTTYPTTKAVKDYVNFIDSTLELKTVTIVTDTSVYESLTVISSLLSKRAFVDADSNTKYLNSWDLVFDLQLKENSTSTSVGINIAPTNIYDRTALMVMYTTVGLSTTISTKLSIYEIDTTNHIQGMYLQFTSSASWDSASKMKVSVNVKYVTTS